MRCNCNLETALAQKKSNLNPGLDIAPIQEKEIQHKQRRVSVSFESILYTIACNPFFLSHIRIRFVFTCTCIILMVNDKNNNNINFIFLRHSGDVVIEVSVGTGTMV